MDHTGEPSPREVVQIEGFDPAMWPLPRGATSMRAAEII